MLGVAAAAAALSLVAATVRRLRSAGAPLPKEGDPWSVTTVTSPLPDEVVSVLLQAQLCYLASLTSLGSEASSAASYQPHLSLMNFTFVRKEMDPTQREVIVLSTRRDTMKYTNLVACPSASILVHSGTSTSITLVGKARTLEGSAANRARAETLRKMHLANNPSSAVFICGEDIAIIEVAVESARICDSSDRVTHWTAAPQ